MGTKFTVFDNALNPERALPDLSNARQELAGIIYVSNFPAHHSPAVLCWNSRSFILNWLFSRLRKQMS